MRVLMLGWEFPPKHIGGLGIASYELSKALSKKGVEIFFVLPGDPGKDYNFLKIISTYVEAVNSPLTPYAGTSMSLNFFNLPREVDNFALGVEKIAKRLIDEGIDLIHAHDWMTFKAGLLAREVLHVPLILHVHSTEIDRSGGNPNPYVYNIEKEGMEKADLVIAVSNFTKKRIVEYYGIPEEKIKVLYNAIEVPKKVKRKKFRSKVVLYLGRFTLQKGPDYFLKAAKKIIQKDPDVTFLMVGEGEMLGEMIEKACRLGITDKVFFTGRVPDVNEFYSIADVYVMPSVSEPFGLTALEALSNKVPVIISKQSGVSEVLSHCLKVDFWDVDDIANKILSVLKYSPLKKMLEENGFTEVKNFSWDKQADKCIEYYKEVIKKIKA
ncbi:MAG: glycosyltransferase family 4 protein [Candidatus Aenigmarchaeota archaeon]|nr:glycosyltransferase family 4 protein [Candidatus Aenigmarchaeota archaeon]